MTKKDLKNAIISLILGVLTMAILQFINGFFEILQKWIMEIISAGATSIVYLKQSWKIL